MTLLRDFRRDWGRWSAGERIGAVLTALVARACRQAHYGAFVLGGRPCAPSRRSAQSAEGALARASSVQGVRGGWKTR
jgi:hypothetical protein